MMLASPSAAIMKRKSVIGSPCLIPFEGMNSCVGLPLTNIEMDVELKQFLIQEIHLLQKPSFFNI